MDIRYKLYPYPMLAESLDDYIDSSFRLSDVQTAKEFHEIKFSFALELKNDELARMIQAGKAEYLIHIECPQTCYRQIIKTSAVTYIHRIPERELNGRVSICAFIVAKEDLPAYHNSAFNPDYEGMTFSIDRGSILAIGGQATMTITKDTEALAKIPSIFTICKCAADTGNGMEIVLESDKIAINLSGDSFGRYRNLASDPKYLPALHSMLILPALIYVFETLRRDGTDSYDNHRWLTALRKNLERSSITLDADTLEKTPSYTLAQKILDFPIDRALCTLAEWSDDESEDA